MQKRSQGHLTYDVAFHSLALKFPRKPEKRIGNFAEYPQVVFLFLKKHVDTHFDLI